MKKLLLLIVLIAAMFAVGAQTQVPVLIEGFDGGGLPSGWAVIDADNDADSWTHSSAFPISYYTFPTHAGSSGSVYSASIDLQTYGSRTPDNWLVSPEVSLSGSSTLTYWVRISDGYYPGDNYGVFVTTVSNPSPSDFTQVFVETMTADDEEWGMRTVNLDSYAGQTVRVAFRHFNCSNNDILILDDVTVLSTSTTTTLSATPGTLDFGNVSVGTVSPSKTVAVSAFNATGPVTASVPSPFEVSADNVAFASTASLPSTGGTLYVRYAPVAVAADSVELVVSVDALTQTVLLRGTGIDCGDITLPFFDGFEDNELNPCWTVLLGSPASTMVYGVQNQFAASGLQSLALSPLYADNYDLYLITPELPASGPKMVSFDHRGYWSSETFVVGYSTSTNDPSAFVWGPTVQSPATESPWNHYQNVNIPGNARYVAVHHTSSDGIMLFIDNFTVSEVSSCMVPYDLNVVNVTPTSADLTWAQTSDNLDITLYYIPDGDTNFVEMQGVVLVDSVYTLYGLTPGATYTWMLGVICDGDTLISDASTFATPCEAVSTLPYVQDFDNVPVDMLPLCWSQRNPYNGFPKVTASNAHSGNAMEFRCDYYDDAPAFAVMPFFAHELSELQVNFWTRREGSNSGSFTVGYLTDFNDVSSFVPVESISAEQLGDNNYHFFNVPFDGIDSTPGINRYVAFRYESTSLWFWYLDDVTVEEIPDCVAPASLAATEVTDATATLHWTGNGDSYNVFYKRAADTAWTTVPGVLLGEGGYLLGGLDFNTTYQWYVESVCDSSSMASYNVATFTTACGVYAAPFVEAFDAAVLPDCWSRYTGLADSVFAGAALAEATGGWDFSSSLVFGAYHAKLNIYGSSRNHWLVTPPIDLSTLANPNLSFDLALTDYANANPTETPNIQNDDRFILMFSTDDGATWSEDDAIIWSNDGSADHVFDWIPAAGQTVSVSLADYAGQTIRIAFYGQSTVTNGDNDLHIDNVTVGETPQCPAPTLLTVGELTSSTATISWSANGGVTAWQVEYVSHQRIYGTNYFAPDSGITVFVYDTPTVTLTGLQDNTLYDVYVTSLCDNGMNSGSPSVTFTTKMEPVALPYSTDFSDTADYNWLINNGSGMNHWHIGTADTTPALYITSDYLFTPQYVVSSTSIVSAVKTLAVGTAEEVLISFDILCGGEGQYDFVKLFLAPVTEEYPASTSTYEATYASATYSAYAYDFTDYLQYSNYHNYPYKFNLTGGNTVHIDAVMPNPNLTPDAGSAANLVFLWRNDFSTGTQPGAIITNLSVRPVTCHQPGSLAVGTVTDHTALISWVAGGGETAWNLEYKPESASTWTVVPVTTTTYTLTGLIPETTYSVRVQSDCGSGDLSVYAYDSFTTDTAATLPPVNPTVTTDSPDFIYYHYAVLRATISNPDHVAISSLGFEWKVAGSDAYTPVTSITYTDTYTYTLAGLSSNTSYTYRAFITYNDTTVYGGEITFTTLEDQCNPPTDFYHIISDTAVHIGWSWSHGAEFFTEFQVSYRQQGTEAWTTVSKYSNGCVIYLTDLLPNTYYEVFVVTVCDNGLTSEPSDIYLFQTPTTGVDSRLGSCVNLYPNPAKEVVNVQCTMNNVQLTGELSVFDVYGKLLQVVPITSEITPINVSGLANGMYFVRVTTEAGAVTKTFVKKG